ncbi:hypothetical protein Plhal304r1_c029g0096311 [Plasmopara halstedii]
MIRDLVMESTLIAMHPYAAGYNGSHKVQYHKESKAVLFFGFLGRLEFGEVHECSPGKLAYKNSFGEAG